MLALPLDLRRYACSQSASNLRPGAACAVHERTPVAPRGLGRARSRSARDSRPGGMGSAPVHPQMGLCWGFLRMAVYISIILDASDIERVDKAR